MLDTNVTLKTMNGQVGANHTGYKRTEVGSVPEDWEVVPIGEAGHVMGGRQRSPHNQGELCRYLRVANVFDGFIDTKDVLEMPFSPAEKERFMLKDGDVLLNEGQSLGLVGRSAIYRGVPEECCFQNTLIRFRAGNKTSPEFAQLVFQHFLGTGVFASIATQTTSIAHLGSGRLAALKMPLPPLPEQHKIAAILTTWDTAIDTTAKLIAAGERRKRGLMREMLSGRRRLREFEEKEDERPSHSLPTSWCMGTLGEVTFESRDRNGNQFGDDRLMGVMKSEGMVPMRDRVRGKSIDRCKVVRPGAFAYNPMRLNIGSIAQWGGDEPVIVSPDYVVFECDPERSDPDFINHVRRGFDWKKFVESVGDGSVRVRIYFSHLMNFEFPLPPLPEQRRIAAVLNACDEELTLLRAQHAALQKQKKGLMQKLLTGTVRVTP